MERSLTKQALVAVFAVVLLGGCEDAPTAEADSPVDSELQRRRGEFYQERAAKIAAHHARAVRFVAEEMAKLDPRSERSAASREARKRLDEIVPRETTR